MSDNIDDRSVWDELLAQRVLGKILLVGITYVEVDGAMLEQQHFFGKVISVHPRKGILIELGGNRSGELFNLPPDTRAINVAAPGEYRLRASGEVVTDPDFMAQFSVSKRV